MAVVKLRKCPVEGNHLQVRLLLFIDRSKWIFLRDPFSIPSITFASVAAAAGAQIHRIYGNGINLISFSFRCAVILQTVFDIEVYGWN